MFIHYKELFMNNNIQKNEVGLISWTYEQMYEKKWGNKPHNFKTIGYIVTYYIHFTNKYVLFNSIGV